MNSVSSAWTIFLFYAMPLSGPKAILKKLATYPKFTSGSIIGKP
jgi:hypothetical protein